MGTREIYRIIKGLHNRRLVSYMLVVGLNNKILSVSYMLVVGSYPNSKYSPDELVT